MNIWFNHNFSSTAQVIRSLKNVGDYHVLASHKRADAPMLAAADTALTEPMIGPDRSEAAEAAWLERYLAWALEVCQRYQIDVLIPERRKLELSRQRERFEAVGTRLLVAAEPETLELVEDKAALYASLPPGLVNIPPYRVVKTAAEFGTGRSVNLAIQNRQSQRSASNLSRASSAAAFACWARCVWRICSAPYTAICSGCRRAS